MIILKYQLNLPNQTIEIEMCHTFFKRLLGFMFQRKKITTGKCFPRCRSIHTFFMLQKIDIIVCNQEMKVIKLRKNFPTNHILFSIRDSFYILELPVGSIKNLKLGDFIYLKEIKR